MGIRILSLAAMRTISQSGCCQTMACFSLRTFNFASLTLPFSRSIQYDNASVSSWFY